MPETFTSEYSTGERIALSSSETVPAGSAIEFTIQCMVDSDMAAVIEWLDYGDLRGIGQWRNSGKDDSNGAISQTRRSRRKSWEGY